MKKQLLLGLAALAALFCAPVASAGIVDDLSLPVNGANGASYRANGASAPWAKYWKNSTYSSFATIKFEAQTSVTSPFPVNCPAGGNVVKMVPVSTTAYDYDLSINADSHYYISGYSFKAVPGSSNTASTINGVELGAEGQLFTASDLSSDETTHSFTLVAAVKGSGDSEVIELRDFVVTLAPIPDQNAAGMPYYARELDGKDMKLYVNDSNRYLILNEGKNGFTIKANSRSDANIWHAEYVTKTAPDGTDLSGIRLSSEGVYLGKMPNAKSESVAVTTDADEAGLWRFFAEGAGYGLSCTEYANGTVVDLQGFGGADEVNKNAWIQIGAGAVQRWGVWPAAAHWNVEVGVPYTLSCGGVNVSALGIVGQTISVAELAGLPDFFEVTEGATITIPAEGETVEVPGQWKFPFEFDTPFFLSLRKNSGTSGTAGTANYKTFNNAYLNSDNNAVIVNVDAKHLTLNPRLIWYMKDAGFVDNHKVVTLHNLSTEGGITVADTLSNPATITANPTKFVVSHNIKGQSAGFGLRVVTETNGYVNDYNGDGKLAVWNSSAGSDDDGSRMWAISLTDGDFNVKSWIADDGLSYKFDSEKLDAAKSSKTLEALRDLFTYTPRENLTREDVINQLSEDLQFVAVRNSLSATGLMTAQEAADAIIAKLEIPAESDDFSSELESAQSALTNFDKLAIVKEKIDGKKVYFNSKANGSNGSNYGNFIGVAEGTVKHATQSTPLDIKAAWEIIFTDATHVKLHNLAFDNYMSGIDVVKSIDDATAYQFDFSVDNNGAFTFRNGDTGNDYLNQGQNNKIGYWNADSNSNGSFWAISLITPAMEQTWFNNVTAEDTRTYGNEPGLYVPLADTTELEALRSEIREAGVANFDYVKVAEALGEEFQPALFDLNSIQGPALIQMAYTPNADVTTYNGWWSGRNQVTDTKSDDILAFGTEASTFVLYNNALHSLESGLGVIFSNAGPTMYDGEDWNENVNAMPIKFSDVDKSVLVADPDGVARHTFSIKQSDTAKTFGGTSNGYKIPWGDNSGTPGAGYAYTVWYVKTLAVNVDESGYKLWRTPVAVNFGDNEANGAYTVSVKGNTITTAPAEASTTYGAGSVFILTQDVILNVENGSNAPAYGTAGLGHHAKQAHQMTAGNVYLTIHADQPVAEQPAPAAVRGLLFDAPELPKVKMAVEIPAEDTTKVLDAHAAVIEAAPSANSTLKDGGAMMLSLGGSNDTTEITEIGVDNSSAAGAIYDLQGRRLAAPAKGINIVNGKKVLCK